MRRALLLLLLLALAPAGRADLPGDSAEGRALLEIDCVSCHDTSVYTRKNRKIKSLSALNAQLASCSHAANVTLTDAEQQSLVKYLNEQFYKFQP